MWVQMEGLQGLIFSTGFIVSLRIYWELLTESIFQRIHTVSMHMYTEFGQYFRAPTLKVCTYVSKDCMRFIAKYIGIYEKIPQK
jgi:hypothetical protein